jgi:acetyl-CoA carboxylase carboxyl transferase subunit alpha
VLYDLSEVRLQEYYTGIVFEVLEFRKKAKEIYSKLDPWERVQLARHPQRPHTIDYIGLIFKDFVELHGDRRFGDDKAIVAGFGYLDDLPVAIMGWQTWF